MSKQECQANEPETCRYHGSIHVHRKELDRALNNYRDVMVEHLKSGKLTPQVSAMTQKAAALYHDAQACVDAHDDEFIAIEKEITALQNTFEGEDQEELHDSFLVTWNDYLERLNRAKAIRDARKHEDNPYNLLYVTSFPETLKNVKRFLKISNCGEFSGVHNSEPLNGVPVYVIVGTEGYYEITANGDVKTIGILKKAESVRTPSAITANPAVQGVNLRWCKNWKESAQSNILDGLELESYTVYSDTDYFIVNPQGGLRSKTALFAIN